MQLKTIPCSISFDIQDREKIPWPPAPKYMLELNEFLDLDKRLFNLIARIVNPNAAMGKDVLLGCLTAKTQR